MFPRPIALASPARQRLYRIALLVTLAIWLLPFLAIVLTSMRSADDLNRGNLWGWPADFDLLENYASVFALSNMGRFVVNSFVIAGAAVCLTIFLSSMAGFALAKYRLPGATWILAAFIAGNFVPFQVLMIPVRELVLSIGLYDTRTGLILFHSAFQTGFATLFMRNFMRELPDSVVEAARLDGASEWRIFASIAMPAMRPAVAGLAVLIFTFVWNDFFWSLVLASSDSVRPVTAGIQALRGMWLTSWHLLSAATVLAAVPPVCVFFLMQRELVAGLSGGRRIE
jgi:multiple sugar transport system permease protein